MDEDIRRVLSKRSVEDKIGIAIDCDLCPAADLATVALLVQDGYLEWIDRTVLLHMAVVNKEGTYQRDKNGAIRRPNADIYKLTPRGIALCNENGIKQR